jgi:ubiquinone/menaquinone biosynthesis C-methylase UbiE
MAAKFSQNIFETPEIWDPATWQKLEGDLKRARQAADWLPGEVRSVLDVGCGNGVFTNLEEPSRFKVGIDLSKIALVNVVAPHLPADAVRLPFADNAFDAIVCMEMLEHLPEAIYQSTLSELLRVSRSYVLITVPYSENLEFNQVICPKCFCRFHPYHHVRQYQSSDINTLFRLHNHLIRLESIVPTRSKALPVLWNLIKLFFHRQGRNYPHGVICPQCGYTLIKSTILAEEVSRTFSVRKSLNRLWPKRNTYTWWMALYQKEP